MGALIPYAGQETPRRQARKRHKPPPLTVWTIRVMQREGFTIEDIARRTARPAAEVKAVIARWLGARP